MDTRPGRNGPESLPFVGLAGPSIHAEQYRRHVVLRPGSERLVAAWNVRAWRGGPVPGKAGSRLRVSWIPGFVRFRCRAGLYSAGARHLPVWERPGKHVEPPRCRGYGRRGDPESGRRSRSRIRPRTCDGRRLEARAMAVWESCAPARSAAAADRRRTGDSEPAPASPNPGTAARRRFVGWCPRRSSVNTNSGFAHLRRRLLDRF